MSGLKDVQSKRCRSKRCQSKRCRGTLKEQCVLKKPKMSSNSWATLIIKFVTINIQPGHTGFGSIIQRK